MAKGSTVVSDLVCPPGEVRRGRILIGFERDSSELCLPTLVMSGLWDGPTLYMGALIHGSELSGIEVVRRVMREAVKPSDLRGTIIAIPIQNPLAFRASSYHSLEDGLNANRIYPGDPSETLTNRAVAAISKYALEQADYVLDIHCNVQDSILFSFVRTGDFPAGPKSVELSRIFGFTTVISHAKRHGFGFEERLVGLMADVTVSAGKPTLTVELTATYNWVEQSIQGAVRGVLNVLKHVGMLPGELEAQPGTLPIINKVLGPQLRVTPDRGGLVHPVAPVGSWVKKGETVARIRDPWGDTIEEIQSPADGYVLSYPHHGNHAAASGDLVVFVAPIYDESAAD